MKGKHKVIVSNNKLHYEFEIKRNITIIKGDSATGKTTLINMIRQFANLGNSSGVSITCDVPCRTLLKYQKTQLNPVYLHEKNERIILDSMKGLEFKNR